MIPCLGFQDSSFKILVSGFWFQGYGKGGEV